MITGVRVQATPAGATSARARPGSALAGFMRARGLHVFEAAGVFWTKYRRFFHESLPEQLRFDPDPGELRAALRAHGVAAVRYPTLTKSGMTSGLWICSPRKHGLEQANRTHRKHIRRGLECFEVRPLDPGLLLSEGLELNLQTMARQRRFDAEFGDARRWKRFVGAVRACPEVQSLGAFREGRLAAYLLACKDGGWLHLMFKMTRTEDLGDHVSAAIDFRAIELAACDPDIEIVSAGRASSLGTDPLAKYKAGVGFELMRHDFGVQFHPALEPFLAATPIARLASRLAPRSRPAELIAKTMHAARISQ